MNRTIRAAAWLAFAAIMYLILVEAVSPWISLPGLGNIGFTLVFVVFALAHCVSTEGWRRTAQFFAVSAVVSYLLEETGVRTGLVYGVYHYSDQLGAKLGHVPVLIPLAWFMMIYPSWAVARTLFRRSNMGSLTGLIAQALVAAWVMTAWDVVMDPGMAASGAWVWEQGGSYFGVPFRNYFGWILTTFLVYWIVGWLWRHTESELGVDRTFAALPVFVYSFFALRYCLQNHFPALQVVALFSMGTPALMALIQLWIRSRTASETGSRGGSDTVQIE
jgi:putative membrane protein